jgi:cell wall-associated NlpC family hydrolase
VILHTQRQVLSRRGKPGRRIKLATFLGGACAALIALPVAPAVAGGGGTSASGSGDGGGGGGGSCRDAKIVHGRAKAPSCAPHRVKKVIWAANEIARGTPYCYGGGHGDFKSSCYDCSGSVSYALHGGHFVDTPMDSSGFMRWGKHGKGDWFTVYSNPSHAFLVVAGLRFDTSMTNGGGPGWSNHIHDERLRDFKHRKKSKY